MKRREFLATTLFGTIAIHSDLSVKEKLKTIPISDSFFDKREDTIVTWLGMAGALINCRGTIVFIDPLISYGASNKECETGNRLLVPLPVTADSVPKADVICYTHADSDHYAEKTAKILNSRLSPTFISPAPVFEHLNKIVMGSARLAETSGAKAMIAYHYGTFDLPAGSYGGCDPADALPYINDLQAVYLKPDPGEIIKLPYKRNPY